MLEPGEASDGIDLIFNSFSNIINGRFLNAAEKTDKPVYVYIGGSCARIRKRRWYGKVSFGFRHASGK